MYKNSRLLFCDHIFNGYGYSQQDFVKQINKTKEDAKLGKFLPNNFRFKYSSFSIMYKSLTKYLLFVILSHPIGNSGYRTAWGGQIGGLESCFEDLSSKYNNK